MTKYIAINDNGLPVKVTIPGASETETELFAADMKRAQEASNRNLAARMLHRLLAAEIEIVKQSNRRGGPTKKAEREERAAVKQVFTMLTGFAPTEEEIDTITNY